MIRIAYLIVDLEIGGTERVVERLVTRLDRRRFEPLVVSLTSPGPVGAAISRAGATVMSLGASGPVDPSAGVLLLRTLRKFRPGIVHSFLHHANAVARLCAPLVGRPAVIVTYRTLEGGSAHWGWERLTWGMCDRIVACSEAVRRHARRASGIPERRIRVIPNGTEVRAVPEARGIVATVCRLERGKGVEDVLVAVDGLAPVRIVGEGSDHGRIRARFPKAEFTGAVPDPTDALDGVSVFVHASRLGEGFPNAVLEAMACGLPVVATDVGGTRELVVEGETGFRVAPGDVGSIRERVRLLLDDPSLARRLGGAGRDRVGRRFPLSAMVEQYEALYRDAAATRGFLDRNMGGDIMNRTFHRTNPPA